MSRTFSVPSSRKKIAPACIPIILPGETAAELGAIAIGLRAAAVRAVVEALRNCRRERGFEGAFMKKRMRACRNVCENKQSRMTPRLSLAAHDGIHCGIFQNIGLSSRHVAET